MSDSRWTGTSTPYLESGHGDAWGKEAAASRATGKQRITFAGEVEAPSEVAVGLSLPEASRVVMRRRLILLDDMAVELADSYWPVDIAKGTALAKQRRIRGGAVSLLAELGYTPASVDEQVTTRRPTAGEREGLGLAENEWVLVLQRVITDASGRPYEASVMVSPGRIGRLNYSMKVD